MERASPVRAVKEAKVMLEEQELDAIIQEKDVPQLAKYLVEQRGIVFIDEIDKICVPQSTRSSSDASDEGVQRDLLPLIEGTIVKTRNYGDIDTSKMLFIASGAFHSCKPSDLMAELQGRLPIRVQLNPLDREDFYRILTEPAYNLIKQQVELMKVEGIKLVFTESAIRQIADITAEMNRSLENIGARRLHTVLEKLVEGISYWCGVPPEESLQPVQQQSEKTSLVVNQQQQSEAPVELIIDADYVKARLKDFLSVSDFKKSVL